MCMGKRCIRTHLLGGIGVWSVFLDFLGFLWRLKSDHLCTKYRAGGGGGVGAETHGDASIFLDISLGRVWGPTPKWSRGFPGVPTPSTTIFLQQTT